MAVKECHVDTLQGLFSTALCDKQLHIYVELAALRETQVQFSGGYYAWSGGLFHL